MIAMRFKEAMNKEIPANNVVGIGLLSKQEAKKLPEDILKYSRPWWLSSPGRFADLAGAVDKAGNIDRDGYYVSIVGNIATRPVIELDGVNELAVGDAIKALDKEWVYIGNGKALLTSEPLRKMAFNGNDAKGNKYATSDIKAYLDQWLKDNKGKNEGLKEELYDIFYDYEDDGGYVSRDNKEEFEGDWHELQQYIKSMRRNGCYNIDAVYREGSSGEYDEVDESLLQDIQRDYKDLNKVNDVNIAKLEDEFQATHKDFFDRIGYHGSVMYSERAWEAFKKWAKKEKGIEIKDFCDEGLKEDIADNDIDKVYKRLSKLNKVDFGKLEDEFLKDRPNVKDAVYKFYGTILNTNRYCKDFIKWAREEKGIDLKGLPCNEGLKEGANKIPNWFVSLYQDAKERYGNDKSSQLRYMTTQIDGGLSDEHFKWLKKLRGELKEDTIKQGNYWVNKGKEGTHGKFKTKKAADAQRKAMFAQGFKEGLNEDFKEMVDWSEVDLRLGDALGDELMQDVEIYFDDPRPLMSGDTTIDFEILWTDNSNGKDIKVRGFMRGNPRTIKVQLRSVNGKRNEKDVDVRNIDEMAKAIIAYGHQ